MVIREKETLSFKLKLLEVLRTFIKQYSYQPSVMKKTFLELYPVHKNNKPYNEDIYKKKHIKELN